MFMVVESYEHTQLTWGYSAQSDEMVKSVLDKSKGALNEIEAAKERIRQQRMKAENGT